mmetsp:Transcript_54669/g.119680  ORF Transcript_54669/g.119680 Transcript_54669/m.119680 type:complete len:104 (+) Transcript_54669:511-822(+)
MLMSSLKELLILSLPRMMPGMLPGWRLITTSQISTSTKAQLGSAITAPTVQRFGSLLVPKPSGRSTASLSLVGSVEVDDDDVVVGGTSEDSTRPVAAEPIVQI